MLVFDKRYNHIVSKYIAPLADYGVPYQKLRQNALKTILTEKVQKIDIRGDTSVVFHFTKSDLMKALINDVSLFYIRALLQREAAQKFYSETGDNNANWSIVTDYYYSFFLAGLFLRLCHRGTMYFDDTELAKLKHVILTLSGTPSKLGNNCTFRIELDENNFEYKLCLSSVSLETHRLVWKEMEALWRDIRALVSDNSEECFILNQIINMHHKIGFSFPAALRNKVNYQPYYGVKEINKDYHPPKVNDLDANWIPQLLACNCKGISNDQEVINIFALYVQYLQAFTFNLLDEYDELRGRGAGTLSSINKNRTTKITPPSPFFTYP